MTRTRLLGLFVAVCAFTAAAASAQAPAAQTAAAQTAAPLVSIQQYYDNVKDIFRKTAVQLGSAVGADRPPLINVQNHCSRSLGKLRAMLRQAQAGGGATETLAASAQARYLQCKTVFDQVSPG